MAKRVRYYYDEASCLYLPVKPSFKSLLLRTLSLVGGSAVIASLIIAAVYFFYDSPKEALLKKQNAALVSQIRQLDQHLAMLEGRVDSLHIQDNNFYRSLLSADRVDENEWNVGVGGSAQAPSEGRPEELLSAEERLARLQSKIDRQTNSYGDLFNRLEDKEDELRHVPAIKPVNGAIISGFGMRNHPIHKIRRMHTGLDMEAAIGTPVYAAGDGTSSSRARPRAATASRSR
jgi:murein DD-endopeptidase MepM/ murein hydrolase activator NlpD